MQAGLGAVPNTTFNSYSVRMCLETETIDPNFLLDILYFSVTIVE